MDKRQLILKEKIAALYNDHLENIALIADEDDNPFPHLTDEELQIEFAEEIQHAQEETKAEQEEMFNIIDALVNGDRLLSEKLYLQWGQHCDERLLQRFDVLLAEYQSEAITEKIK